MRARAPLSGVNARHIFYIRSTSVNHRLIRLRCSISDIMARNNLLHVDIMERLSSMRFYESRAASVFYIHICMSHIDLSVSESQTDIWYTI